ncbi:MAG: hypothetical protein L3J04_03030 [Robiginitomaculum sp.]|nr:hypothetical protein [Robiginitomaculum sp.]
MNFGFLISVLLHFAVIFVGVTMLPDAMQNRTEITPVIPVDLVMLAEETNIKEVIAEIPEPIIEKKLVSEPVVEQPKTIEPEPIIQPVKPKPKVNKPEPIVKKEVVKPKPKPKPKPPTFDLARLDKKLATNRPVESEFDKLLEKNITSRAAIGAADALSVDEVDLLRSQMYGCWRAPLDAPNPEKLVVRVKLRLNVDGSLQGAPEVLNQNRINSSNDPFWRAASSSAHRAVIRCQPYSLPAEKYASWQEIILTFNAAEMMGISP